MVGDKEMADFYFREERWKAGSQSLIRFVASFRMGARCSMDMSSDMKVIVIEEIQSCYARADFDILEVQTCFEMSSLRRKVRSLIQKYGLQLKDDYTTYFGLGLQYHDDKNPFFDAINSTDFSGQGKKIFNKRNEASFELDVIYQKFPRLQLSRGRILVAKPGFRMRPHTDGPWIMNLHIPLETNPLCRINVDQRSYYLPAMGNSFLVNATRPHAAFNRSNEERIHIVFPIGPPSFAHWTEEERRRFQDYYEMMGLS